MCKIKWDYIILNLKSRHRQKSLFGFKRNDISKKVKLIMVTLNFSFTDLPTSFYEKTDQLIGFCVLNLVWNSFWMSNLSRFWSIFFNLKIENMASIMKIHSASSGWKSKSDWFIWKFNPVSSSPPKDFLIHRHFRPVMTSSRIVWFSRILINSHNLKIA